MDHQYEKRHQQPQLHRRRRLRSHRVMDVQATYRDKQSQSQINATAQLRCSLFIVASAYNVRRCCSQVAGHSIQFIWYIYAHNHGTNPSACACCYARFMRSLCSVFRLTNNANDKILARLLWYSCQAHLMFAQYNRTITQNAITITQLHETQSAQLRMART